MSDEKIERDEAFENVESSEIEFESENEIVSELNEVFSESEDLNESSSSKSVFVEPKEYQTIEIKGESSAIEAQEVKVKSKMNGRSILAILLTLVLVSSSTFTIGYYQGQIHVNEDKLMERVNELLDQNLDSKLYKSVVDYLDENGSNITVGDVNIAEIYKNASKSVVGLTSKLKYYDWFNNEQYSEGTGSGVVIKEERDKFYVVTNYHVVDGATEVVAEISQDQIVPASLVGYDEDSDLAVVCILKKDIPSGYEQAIRPIQIGQSKALEVGEPAIAIGNPLGYNNTVTYGVVSALDRKVNEDQANDYIQTDAAINPGNSGGALVNKSGELIGINTAKIAETSVEGIGFAIPVDTIMPIVSELIDKGYISKPFMGIGGVDIDQEAADLYEIPIGVFVKYVYDDSPAKKAGIKERDVIIGIDDQKVYTMNDLTSIIADHEPGDQIEVKVIREGNEKVSINLTLEDRNKYNTKNN